MLLDKKNLVVINIFTNLVHNNNKFIYMSKAKDYLIKYRNNKVEGTSNTVYLSSVGSAIDFWVWVYPVNKDNSLDYENRVHAKNCDEEWFKALDVGDKFAVSCFINNLDEQEIVNNKLNSLL